MVGVVQTAVIVTKMGNSEVFVRKVGIVQEGHSVSNWTIAAIAQNLAKVVLVAGWCALFAHTSEAIRKPIGIQMPTRDT